MKILTWNVERFKSHKIEIKELIESFNADIIVLTETSSEIDLNNNYNCVATVELPSNHDGIVYKANENRTTIWTKYEVINQTETFDNYTSICAQIKTEFGNLNIYATIIGVFGGKGERFKNDLKQHLDDFKKFNINEINCIIGDLNTTFSGFTYPSHYARNTLNETFESLKMKNLTAEIPNNVDHIILSENILENKIIETQIWNLDKKLSDHIGICLSISER